MVCLQYGKVAEPLLLWLSIAKRLFTPYSEEECTLDSKSDLGQEERKERRIRQLIVAGLLEANSFIPFLVHA